MFPGRGEHTAADGERESRFETGWGIRVLPFPRVCVLWTLDKQPPCGRTNSSGFEVMRRGGEFSRWRTWILVENKSVCFPVLPVKPHCITFPSEAERLGTLSTAETTEISETSSRTQRDVSDSLSLHQRVKERQTCFIIGANQNKAVHSSRPPPWRRRGAAGATGTMDGPLSLNRNYGMLFEPEPVVQI